MSSIQDNGKHLIEVPDLQPRCIYSNSYFGWTSNHTEIFKKLEIANYN